MRLLLTNDDGVDSPALVPFARSLAALGEVRVVVPDRERSWIGKAISRHDPIEVATTTRDGLAITTCSGYPADATQIGVHVLGEGAPDLVVSGINLGFNHGAAFLMTSGTVGAAIEGWISGIPAIAFSTGVWGGGYDGWRRHAESPASADGWRNLAATCTAILRDLHHAGAFAHADVLTVNLPFDATPDTPRRLTSVARVGYDRLFAPDGDGRYRHDFSGILQFGDLAGTDVEAAREGLVSITPLRLPHAAEVPAPVRAAIEQG